MIPKDEPRTDFDEATGKLVPVPVTGLGRTSAPEAEPFATDPAPAKEPFLANPLKLAPTGSGSGHVSRADFARAGVAMVSVYGLLQMASPLIVQFLTALGPDGAPRIPHGDVLADAFAACIAAAVAITHVFVAYTSDNRPRPDPADTAPAVGPRRVP